jgi:hypothetical protein
MGLFSMFLSDDGKTWSSQRFIAVVVCLFWSLTIGVVWAVQSVKTGVMQPIPDSLIMISGSSMGIALTGKVVNSIFGEKKSE